MYFKELQLHKDVLLGIENAGFEVCTEVQERAIPAVLNGEDVMVQSQTGTGKTAAFFIPTMQLLQHHADFQQTAALVVVPTRELAVQIGEEAQVLCEGMSLRSAVFYGGVGYTAQGKALASNL